MFCLPSGHPVLCCAAMFSLVRMSQDRVMMDGPSRRGLGLGAVHVHSLCMCVYDCVYVRELGYACRLTVSSSG